EEARRDAGVGDRRGRGLAGSRRGGVWGACRAPTLLIFDEGLEVPSAQRVAKLAQRLGLDLANALARHGEALADLLQRVLAFLADAEPEAEDLLLLRRQHGQRPLHLGGEILAQQRIVRRPRRLVLEEIAELRVLTDRRLKRERLARRLEDEPDLLGRHAGPLGQFLRSGLAAKL